MTTKNIQSNNKILPLNLTSLTQKPNRRTFHRSLTINDIKKPARGLLAYNTHYNDTKPPDRNIHNHQYEDNSQGNDYNRNIKDIEGNDVIQDLFNQIIYSDPDDKDSQLLYYQTLAMNDHQLKKYRFETKDFMLNNTIMTPSPIINGEEKSILNQPEWKSTSKSHNSFNQTASPIKIKQEECFNFVNYSPKKKSKSQQHRLLSLPKITNDNDENSDSAKLFKNTRVSFFKYNDNHILGNAFLQSDKNDRKDDNHYQHEKSKFEQQQEDEKSKDTQPMLVKVGTNAQIIQPSYMQEAGSMCFTELWSKKTKKNFYHSINRRDAKIVRFDNLKNFFKEIDGVFKPSKLSKMKEILNKMQVLNGGYDYTKIDADNFFKPPVIRYNPEEDYKKIKAILERKRLNEFLRTNSLKSPMNKHNMTMISTKMPQNSPEYSSSTFSFSKSDILLNGRRRNHKNLTSPTRLFKNLSSIKKNFNNNITPIEKDDQFKFAMNKVSNNTSEEENHVTNIFNFTEDPALQKQNHSNSSKQQQENLPKNTLFLKSEYKASLKNKTNTKNGSNMLATWFNNKKRKDPVFPQINPEKKNAHTRYGSINTTLEKESISAQLLHGDSIDKNNLNEDSWVYSAEKKPITISNLDNNNNDRDKITEAQNITNHELGQKVTLYLRSRKYKKTKHQSIEKI